MRGSKGKLRGTESSASLGPLFETPVTRVLDRLPANLRSHVEAQLRDALVPGSQLREEVAAHLRSLEEVSTRREFVDLGLARRVASDLDRLISLADRRSLDERRRRLIQAAVRYFALDRDAEGDTASPIGFDDDELVVRAVARELGFEDAED